MIKLIIFTLLLCTFSFAQNGVGYKASNEAYQVTLIPIDSVAGVPEFEYGSTVPIPISWDHVTADSPDPWNTAVGDSIKKNITNNASLWNNNIATYNLNTNTPEFTPGTYYQAKIRTYGVLEWIRQPSGIYTPVKGYTIYSESSARFLLRELETAQVPSGVQLQ